MTVTASELLDREIENEDDVRAFFVDIARYPIIFHPDENGQQYVNGSTGERTFTEDEAIKFNVLVDKCFDLVGERIYEISYVTQDGE